MSTAKPFSPPHPVNAQRPSNAPTRTMSPRSTTTTTAPMSRANLSGANPPRANGLPGPTSPGTSGSRVTQWHERIQPAVVLAALIVGVAVNAFYPRGDNDVGAVSERTEPLLSAAPFAFAIWGVIFAWTLAYGVWQALPAQRTQDGLGARLAPFVIVNALGGAAWTVLFTNGAFTAAWIVIVAMLVSLIVVMRRSYGVTGAAHWFARAPFLLNLGWLCVAVVLNTAQLLSTLGFTAGATAWAGICIMVATVLGFALSVFQKARFATAAIGWGLLGVGVDMAAKDGNLSILAFGCSAVMAVTVVVSFWVSLAPRLRQRFPRRGDAPAFSAPRTAP